MKCEIIQEIILTDYLDGQLSKVQENQINGHMEQCQRCREFAAICREQVVEPFQNAEQLPPPDEVWTGIKDFIQSETVSAPLKNSFLTDLARGLNGMMGAFKPVFFPFAMAVIILGVFMLLKTDNLSQSTAGNNSEEPIDYLASLLNDAEEGEDYGIFIEEYFL